MTHQSVPMAWRLKQNRYALVGTQCGCGARHMPPRHVCECGSAELKPCAFSGAGEIISYTTIHVAPAGFEKNVPYNIALVRLAEGPVVSGVVVDRNIAIGKRVKVVFRRLYADGDDGLLNYGFKFEVVD